MPEIFSISSLKRAQSFSRALIGPMLVLLLAFPACKEQKTEAVQVGPGASTQPAPAASSSPKVENTPPPVSSCPEEMVFVDGYCIDKYEAHLVRADAPEKVLPHYKPLSPGLKAMARSRAGFAPQGYVNRKDAVKACKAANKRLCTAKEWYGACIGSKKTRYPYGETETSGRCNTGKDHLMTLLFGTHIKYTYTLHYNHARLHQEPGFLAKTGEYQGCVNDYGVYDMVGNLHEWVLDDGSLSLAKKIPLDYGPELLGTVGSGVFMGGYFSSRAEHGRGCVYATATHSPDYHDYSIGFRCCADGGAGGM